MATRREFSAGTHVKPVLALFCTWIAASAPHCPGHTTASQPSAVQVLPRCTILCVDYRGNNLSGPGLTIAEHKGPDLASEAWVHDYPPEPYNDARHPLTGEGPIGKHGRQGIDEVWVRDENIAGRDAVFFVDAISVAPAPGGGSTLSGPALSLRRQAADGSWSTVATGDFERETFVPRVSLAALGDTVAFCATTQGFNAPNIQRPRVAVYGLWTARGGVATIPLRDVELGDTRYPPVSSPAAGGLLGQRGAGDLAALPSVITCAGVRAPNGATTELHACLVTNDGRLWHAIRREGALGADGYREMWSPFGDVEAQIGDIGFVTTVDCTAQGNALHLVAVGRFGNVERIWRATRLPDGTWRGSRHDNGVISPRDDVLLTAASPAAAPTGPIRDIAVGFCHQGTGTSSQPVLVMAFVTDTDVRYVLWQEAAREWPPAGTGRSTYSPIYVALRVSFAPARDSRTGNPIIAGGQRFLSVTERPFSHDPARAQAGQ